VRATEAAPLASLGHRDGAAWAQARRDPRAFLRPCRCVKSDCACSPRSSCCSRFIRGLGRGRIYEQTFVDTYSKVGLAKLYHRKTPITAADLLNDRVVPFFEEHGVRLLRVLTDRGSEYCGNPQRHATSCTWRWRTSIVLAPKSSGHVRPGFV
jgi:hypothetical protein